MPQSARHPGRGFDSQRLEHLKATITADIAAGRYFGAVILIARSGQVGLAQAIGVRRDLAERHIFQDFRGKPPQEHLGRSNLGPQGAFAQEQAEMPWVGAISSVPDLFRFAEMLRQGGTLDGRRILSPAMLSLATRNWTADKRNELYKSIAINHGWEPYPAYIGHRGRRRAAVFHNASNEATLPRSASLGFGDRTLCIRFGL